jgi:hypothetical protein
VGIVLGERSEPVADFVAYAEPLDIGEARPRSQRFVSPSGEFRMALAPGVYALRVAAPGYVPGGLEKVVVRAGASPGSVRVVLGSGAVVRGRTVDEKGGAVEGVRVATNEKMLWAFGRAAPVPSGAFAVSDATGAFTLTGVAPGEKVPLFAYKEGLVQKAPAAANAARGAEAAEVVVVMKSRYHPEGDREFGGVGMTLGRSENGDILVADVFEGGPAREAGARPGDQVLSVDGAAVTGWEIGEVVGRIRGEVGTTVTLGMRRAGRDFQIAVQRASVKF